PARAWSEWPWVMTAFSTGRVGSIWKPPSVQYTPAGGGIRTCPERMEGKYGVIGAMTDGTLFISSGEPPAYPRLESALELAACGDLAGAAEILVQTVTLAPAFATAWFALGAIHDNLGDRAGATMAWTKTRDADPDDYHGARLQLARIGACEGVPAMTAAYLRRLFDRQARHFD